MEMIQTVEQYKEYLKSRLQPVSDILPNIIEGDFSRRLEIPTEKDEFTELYMGINFLLRDLDEQLKQREYAEKALRESEQKYKTLFEASPEGIIIIDLDGKILKCNAAVPKLTKLPRETLIGKQFMELGLLNPEELSKIMEMFPKLVRGDCSGTGEVQIRSGEQKRYLEAFPAVIEEDSEISALQIMIRDITERKIAEEALRENERRYRLLAENVTDIIWTVDMDLRYTYISPSVTRLQGYSVEEAMALSVDETLTPASMEVVMKTLADELARENGGQKDVHRSQTLEFEQYCKDGHTIWTEATMTFLRDPDGRPVGILGVTRDITERKRAEETLQKSEERYRDLFENANDLIQSVDSEGNFVYINMKWLETLGYSKEELKKLNLTDILRKDQIPHCMEIFKKVCSGETFGKVETIFITKDGREIIVEGNVNAYFKDGRFVSTRGIFRDITERKQAEDKLEQTVAKLARSNAELEHFAYIASHDLQEPLRMVSSYVQLIERRYKGRLDEDADEFIAFAVDGASRMRALINGLLTYSRVDTRAKPFEPTDSEIIFKQATDNLKVAIEESGAVITHDPLPTVMADDLQLSQLLQNLIGNGIKFSSERQPQINVSAEKKENEWLFSIRDNGIGIDPKNQERIFQIFKRLHSRSEYQGTGIGLAVCKKIAERHGGRIWVESGLGKGSTFYFTITNTGGDRK